MEAKVSERVKGNLFPNYLNRIGDCESKVSKPNRTEQSNDCSTSVENEMVGGSFEMVEGITNSKKCIEPNMNQCLNSDNRNQRHENSALEKTGWGH